MYSPALVDAQAEVLELAAGMGCPSKLIAERYKLQVVRLLLSGMLPLDVAHEAYAIAARDAYDEAMAKNHAWLGGAKA